eukprot:c14088_g1_i1 orf=3-266(-)
MRKRVGRPSCEKTMHTPFSHVLLVCLLELSNVAAVVAFHLGAEDLRFKLRRDIKAGVDEENVSRLAKVCLIGLAKSKVTFSLCLSLSL